MKRKYGKRGFLLGFMDPSEKLTNATLPYLQKICNHENDLCNTGCPRNNTNINVFFITDNFLYKSLEIIG